MNVYVITDRWADGAQVVGAGADLSDAMRLGDQDVSDELKSVRWEPSDADRVDRYTTWTRRGGEFWQEIRMVPLTGQPPGDVRNPQGVVAEWVDLSALPLHDPQWVAAELRRRGVRPFVAGTVLPSYAPDYGVADIQRWLDLAGESASLPTAAGANRGRLIEMMSATTGPG